MACYMGALQGVHNPISPISPPILRALSIHTYYVYGMHTVPIAPVHLVVCNELLDNDKHEEHIPYWYWVYVATLPTSCYAWCGCMYGYGICPIPYQEPTSCKYVGCIHTGYMPSLVVAAQLLSTIRKMEVTPGGGATGIWHKPSTHSITTSRPHVRHSPSVYTQLREYWREPTSWYPCMGCTTRR